jgi:hypothetical protein
LTRCCCGGRHGVWTFWWGQHATFPRVPPVDIIASHRIFLQLSFTHSITMKVQMLNTKLPSAMTLSTNVMANRHIVVIDVTYLRDRLVGPHAHLNDVCWPTLSLPAVSGASLKLRDGRIVLRPLNIYSPRFLDVLSSLPINLSRVLLSAIHYLEPERQEPTHQATWPLHLDRHQHPLRQQARAPRPSSAAPPSAVLVRLPRTSRTLLSRSRLLPRTWTSLLRRLVIVPSFPRRATSMFSNHSSETKYLRILVLSD